VGESAEAEQAQPAAQRRRRHHSGGGGEVQDQPQAERPTRGDAARQARQRLHADLLTVAFRGPLAGRFREMAERHQLSLAKLVQDALLAYEGRVANGYQPGTALTEWKARQTQEGDGA
jgi:hypothetical protein